MRMNPKNPVCDNAHFVLTGLLWTWTCGQRRRPARHGPIMPGSACCGSAPADADGCGHSIYIWFVHPGYLFSHLGDHLFAHPGDPVGALAAGGEGKGALELVELAGDERHRDQVAPHVEAVGDAARDAGRERERESEKDRERRKRGGGGRERVTQRAEIQTNGLTH